MPKILMIEDDRELNQGVSYTIEKAGYAVFWAYSTEDARRMYERESADLILLDVNLPDGEGFDFCRWVKIKGEARVLFLNARDLEEDVLRGYELGADDYVTKPFSVNVLLKKIRVILKRDDDGFLKIDFERAKVEAGEQTVSLLPQNFACSGCLRRMQGSF